MKRGNKHDEERPVRLIQGLPLANRAELSLK